jgi:hypothetical protein
MPFEIKALLVEPLPKQMKIEDEKFTPFELALCVEHLQFFCFKCTILHCMPPEALEKLQGPINEIRMGFVKLKRELDQLLTADKKKQAEAELSSRLIELVELTKEAY